MAKLLPDLEAARRHILMLTGQSNPVLAWQWVPDYDRKRDISRSAHGRLNTLLPTFKQRQAEGCAIYIAVNETDGTGRREDCITTARAIFLDFDGEPLPKQWPIEPHLITQSSNVGGVAKYQAWWAINHTTDYVTWKALTAALARKYKADPKCALLTQVGRCAGFWHQKDKQHPWQVRIIHDRVDEISRAFGLTLQEVADAFDINLLAEVSSMKAKSRAHPKLEEPEDGWDNDVDVQLARAWLSDPLHWKRTSNGEVSLYGAALRCYDLGISPEKATELIMKHCPIPVDTWTDDWIEKKIRNAYQYSKGVLGGQSVAGDFKDDPSDSVDFDV